MVIRRAARIPATATEAVPATEWTEMPVWPRAPPPRPLAEFSVPRTCDGTSSFPSPSQSQACRHAGGPTTFCRIILRMQGGVIALQSSRADINKYCCNKGEAELLTAQILQK